MRGPINFLELLQERDRERGRIDACRRQLEKALGALADIALAEDLDEAGRRAKAKRVYEEITSICL